MLLGEGARGHSLLPPPLKPIPQPQLGLLALPKGQKKKFPFTYTAKEEFFNSLLGKGPAVEAETPCGRFDSNPGKKV